MGKKLNDQLSGHLDLLDTVLLEKDGVQYRLTVSEFRESNYLSIREWYMDFDEDWKPSKNGFTIPYNLDTVSLLFDTLVSLLSEAEVLDIIKRHERE